MFTLVTNNDIQCKCEEFIRKVSELKFNKVRQRQINKLNILVNRSKNNSQEFRQANPLSTTNNRDSQAQDNNNNRPSHRVSSNNRKWVINLSSVPLTPAQESLLSKGPYFALAPTNPPNGELISGIGSVCHKLLEQDAQELRAETNCLLRRAKPPKPNITKEDKALKELRQDKERMVLTVDKGVAMVVRDRKEYMEKVEGLLAQLAYRTITADPTSKLKARLIQTLNRIKRDTNMEEGMYKVMYHTGCIPPKFCGLPKIHKIGTPLRPIVSRRGSVTYGVAKVIAKVLKPLVGKSPHHIQSTSDFVSEVKDVTLLPGECLSSYDVTSLFTSVPIDPALNVINNLLKHDETLSNRTVLSVQHIIELLGFCLHNTYFSFQNR